MVNPDMCVNQSRHTVSFSDLAWPETAASFPKAWEVGLYLERYIKTYPGYEIRLKTKVVGTNFREGKWKVRVREQEDEKVCDTEIMFSHHLCVTPSLPCVQDSTIHTTRSNENIRAMNSTT
jgi:cation diffusion facilitator CzcD-associated flavoprotein CzcO